MLIECFVCTRHWAKFKCGNACKLNVLRQIGYYLHFGDKLKCKEYCYNSVWWQRVTIPMVTIFLTYEIVKSLWYT